MIRDLWLVLTGKLSYWQVVNLTQRLTQWEERNTLLMDTVQSLTQQTAELNLGVGVLISKLMPTFGIDYNEPKIRRESDALGKKVIEALIAEDKARRHTEGRP